MKGGKWNATGLEASVGKRWKLNLEVMETVKSFELQSDMVRNRLRKMSPKGSLRRDQMKIGRSVRRLL